MRIPLVLAHGPGLEVLVPAVAIWMVISYGLPLLARSLTKKAKKGWAIGVGLVAFAFSVFTSVTFARESFFLLFLGVVPALISSVVLILAFRSKAKAIA